MEKINFESLPSTKTPITATNLNQLQTNVENAINGVVLYENPSGTMGTITLSDNTSNYRYIEIYGKVGDGGAFSTKVQANVTTINLQTVEIDSGVDTSYGFIICAKKLSNNGTTLTVKSTARLWKYENSGSLTQDRNDAMPITKVIGIR